MKLLESIAWKANANKRGLITTTSVKGDEVTTGGDPYGSRDSIQNNESKGSYQGGSSRVDSSDKYEVAVNEVGSETDNNSQINIQSFDFRSMYKSISAHNDIENKFPTIGSYRYMSDFARMLTETKQEVTPIDMVKIVMYFPRKY